MLSVAVSFICTVLYIVHGNHDVDELKDELNRIGRYELLNVNTDSFLPDNIIEFDAFNQHYKVKLTANEGLVPSALDHTNGNLANKYGLEVYYTDLNKSCHYLGTVLNADNHCLVALSMCNGRGIRGIISAFGETITIKPSAYYLNDEYDRFNYHHINDEHLVYKLSDYNKTHNNDRNDVEEKDIDNTLKIKKYESSIRRRLIYNNGDNVVEILILADPFYVDYFKELYPNNWYDQMVSRLSDIVNGATAEYINQDWGAEIGRVSLKWVELEVVESYNGIYQSLYPETLPNGEIDSSAYIRQFRTWLLNNKNMNTFDAAILYTLDMDSSGRAFKYTLCDNGGWSVSVIADHGTLAREVKLMAHEIGHNFGMEHDEPQYNNCPDVGIMGDGDYNTGWTSCSVDYMQSWFAQNNGLSCLANRNNPFKTNYNGGIVPPSPPGPSPIASPSGPTSPQSAICENEGPCSCPTGTRGICTISCVGKDSCKDGLIQCNNDGYQCTVDCVGESSCSGSTHIMGPIGSRLNVNCVGDKSCEGGLIIYGERGTDLTVLCDSSTSCKSAELNFGSGIGSVLCVGEPDACIDARFNTQNGATFECIGQNC